MSVPQADGNPVRFFFALSHDSPQKALDSLRYYNDII